MTFSTYLKQKQKLIILWVSFHSIALFVNFFHIKGSFSEYPSPPGYTFYLFTSSHSKSDFNQSSKDFWPFVEYLDKWSPDLPQPDFYGVFNRYDFSEFIAYLVILLVILYFRWNSKYETKNEK
jgi:hypothetical protein